jgi:hypothetical protein
MKKNLTYVVIGVALAMTYLKYHPDSSSNRGGPPALLPAVSPIQPTDPIKAPPSSEPATQPSPPPELPAPTGNAVSTTPENPDVGSDTSDIRDGAPIDLSRPTLLHFGLPMVAEREGKVHHCQNGVLTLTALTGEFRCQSEAKRSVTFSVREARVDQNGVQDTKDKYHFRIQGLSQEEVIHLFENWVNQGRVNSQ